MIVISGGDLILPHRVVTEGSLVVDSGRIAAIESRRVEPADAEIVDATECYVVPGFIDVHVHGLHGHDTLDGADAVAPIAARLPRYGVTAFCPTTVACSPAELRAFLQQVRRARVAPVTGSARVLPAHLESNFINPEYRGAQPAECLRLPPAPDDAGRLGDFSGRDILDVMNAAGPDVGIVTLAPELPGAIELVTSLVSAGRRVSIGHSGADVDQAIAAIDAGARHATHLFNRMSPISHRAPGVAGAVLAREEVAVELICDGYHVHPVMSCIAIAAKGRDGVMAVTDGTAGSGLQVGADARLGGRRIRVTESAAVLDDGTLAGSTLTMDRAFRIIVQRFGVSVVDAAVLCSTTPARELGLVGFGVIARDCAADVVVLDRGFRVVYTFIAGRAVFGTTVSR